MLKERCKITFGENTNSGESGEKSFSSFQNSISLALIHNILFITPNYPHVKQIYVGAFA